VTRLLQRDRVRLSLSPCRPGTGGERGIVKRPGAVVAEHESILASARQLVLEQRVAEEGDDRHLAAASTTLRLNIDALLRVVGAVDTDHTSGEIDVLPAKRHQLATSKASVESGRPQAAITVREQREQCGRSVRRHDPLTLAAHSREAHAGARVDGHVTVLDRAAEDHAQRHDRVADRRRARAGGEHLVGERLHVAAAHVGELRAGEQRQDPVTERLLVATDDGRLVDVARAVAHQTGAHAGEESVGGLLDGRGRRRAEAAALYRGERVDPPRLRRRLAREGLADRSPVAWRPDARLPPAAAGAPPALAAGAARRVTPPDPARRHPLLLRRHCRQS
jgi:hypothetical protein